MSRVTAPLLSFDARGQIGKTQVYADWKGRAYARRYVIPANPQTSGQTETRDTFSWLNAVWRYMPTGAIDAWNAYGSNSRFTARNGWIKQNLTGLRSQPDLANIVLSPSANGGIVAAGMVLTAGANQITVDLTAPSLPTGWTITAANALAIADQDPQTGTLYDLTYGTDVSSPYQIILTGLTSAQLYWVGGWFEFAKSLTETAYGLAILDSETPT